MIAKAFRGLISAPPEPRAWWKVIAWWELRRIPCNIIVGGIGLICLLLFFLFIHLAHALQPGEDAIEPMVLFAAPILFNIAYTGGWIAELFLRIVSRERNSIIASTLLKLGLSFSLFIAILPAAIWFFIWVIGSI